MLETLYFLGTGLFVFFIVLWAVKKDDLFDFEAEKKSSLKNEPSTE